MGKWVWNGKTLTRRRRISKTPERRVVIHEHPSDEEDTVERRVVIHEHSSDEDTVEQIVREINDELKEETLLMRKKLNTRTRENLQDMKKRLKKEKKIRR